MEAKKRSPLIDLVWECQLSKTKRDHTWKTGLWSGICKGSPSGIEIKTSSKAFNS